MDNWLETKNLQVHFVSAAGVVFREGKVLMIRSERRGWEFPGGVVEQGEAILDGLKREILEESGITAEPECVTGIYQNIVKKKGYGPLEGMDLPTTVNMVFRLNTNLPMADRRVSTPSRTVSPWCLTMPREW